MMNIRRNIKLLSWFNFFTDFIFYAPIAILYFSQVSGSFTLGMSVFAVTQFASALFEVPTGIFSDSIGRKRTIIFGAVASTVAIFCYALGFSYSILIVGAIFEGLARSLYSGNNNALLYDTAVEMGQQESYHELLGKTSSTSQLALAISALLGGFLAFYSFGLVFWISVLSPIICLIISLYIVEPKEHSSKSTNIYEHFSDAFKQFLSNRKLRLLSLSSMAGYGIGESMWLFRSAFVALIWPTWALGLVQALSNLGATASFYFSGKLINRFKELKLLITGAVYSKIIDLVALIFPSIISPALMASSSLFFGVITVSEDNLMQKEFTDHQRATMASINSLGKSIFFGIFAIVLGKVADIVGPTQTLIFATLLTLPILLIYKKLYSHKE